MREEGHSSDDHTVRARPVRDLPNRRAGGGGSLTDRAVVLLNSASRRICTEMPGTSRAFRSTRSLVRTRRSPPSRQNATQADEKPSG